MLIDKLKYVQGYVKIRLTGYAPERFFNLCSNHNILIWNLEFENSPQSYVFCISVKGLKSLKPILKKTRTKFEIVKRYGLPFYAHRYRKRKFFLIGVVLCCCLLWSMSLFVWKIQIDGNVHRTDSSVIKFLEKNNVYHGLLKSNIDCEEIEELLRTGYDDIIWASAKLEGTMLVIDIQENLATNQQAVDSASQDGVPSDIIADKDAVIYSIVTRNGVPYVEKGTEVHPGDLLVEGKISIPNDNGETAAYQYCVSDADILGVTQYPYENMFSILHDKKVFSGSESKRYGFRFFQKQVQLPEFSKKFKEYDTITEEYTLKIGDSFYLPLIFTTEVHKEYQTVQKQYTKQEAQQLAKEKLNEFCEKLTQKGIQIIENNVMIATDEKQCSAYGSLKVIEPIGTRQATTVTDVPQEGQITDESDGNSD